MRPTGEAFKPEYGDFVAVYQLVVSRLLVICLVRAAASQSRGLNETVSRNLAPGVWQGDLSGRFLGGS